MIQIIYYFYMMIYKTGRSRGYLLKWFLWIFTFWSDDIEEACFDERENKFFEDKFMKFLEIFLEKSIELILVDILIWINHILIDKFLTEDYFLQKMTFLLIFLLYWNIGYWLSLFKSYLWILWLKLPSCFSENIFLIFYIWSFCRIL